MNDWLSTYLGRGATKLLYTAALNCAQTVPRIGLRVELPGMDLYLTNDFYPGPHSSRVPRVARLDVRISG